jgi:hypothetical protein
VVELIAAAVGPPKQFAWGYLSMIFFFQAGEKWMSLKMNISLELSKETAEQVARAASDAGKDVSSFLEELVTQSLRAGEAPRRNVAEILAPFRSEVERSGVTDEQLDRLFNEAREGAFVTRRSYRK